LYLRGIRTKLKTVYNNLEHIEHIINTEGALVNDVIAHCRHINVDADASIYEYNRWLELPHKGEQEAKKSVCKALLSSDLRPQDWMLVKGRSAVVYSLIESRGVRCGPYIVHPRYNTSTFTGRSKTYGFNIQGSTEDDPIEHPNGEFDHFLHFDWVAADFRMASLLSKDKNMFSCYETSDPYQYISDLVSDNQLQISRSECKNDLLKSMYALSIDSPLLDLFPDLKSWMLQKIDEYHNADIYDFRTRLGMPIPHSEIKRSFNAMIQGSIAEAIQCVLVTLRKMHDCILTETHDAIIIACSRDQIDKWLQIADIAIKQPFRQLFNDDISMPLSINIGRQWKRWKQYRTIR
jgi:hypothetical protein